MLGENTTYFAFGSNIDQGQMEARCPSAVLLATATLRGHRLDFAGWSKNWRGGVATLTPSRDETVVGVLWSITCRDLFELDRIEGHPHYYRRSSVVVDSDDLGKLSAWTYRLQRRLVAPSGEYLRTICEARALLGIVDEDVVDAAIRADEAEREREQYATKVTESFWNPPKRRVIVRKRGP